MTIKYFFPDGVSFESFHAYDTPTVGTFIDTSSFDSQYLNHENPIDKPKPNKLDYCGLFRWRVKSVMWSPRRDNRNTVIFISLEKILY